MADTKISQLTEKTELDWWEELVYAQEWDNGKLTVAKIKEFVAELPTQTWNDWKFLRTNWTSVSRESMYSDFELKNATSWATLTISDFSTVFTPDQNFSLVAWTVIPGMQYIIRITSSSTAYTMSLWTWITNPFNEDLTLTASKTTTVVLFATSSSSLELFSIKTAE